MKCSYKDRREWEYGRLRKGSRVGRNGKIRKPYYSIVQVNLVGCEGASRGHFYAWLITCAEGFDIDYSGNVCESQVRTRWVGCLFWYWITQLTDCANNSYFECTASTTVWRELKFSLSKVNKLRFHLIHLCTKLETFRLVKCSIQSDSRAVWITRMFVATVPIGCLSTQASVKL